VTTLGDLKAEVYEAAGGRNDTVVQTAAERGLNAGLLMATYIFEPPEQVAHADLTVTSAAELALTALTRLIRVNQVYNVSRSKVVNTLEYKWLNRVHIDEPTNPDVEYYSQMGTSLFFRPVPTASQSITLWYLQYPARLTLDAEALPFELHQDFVLAMGNIFVQAVVEENENVVMWSNLMTAVGTPEVEPTMISKLLRGEVSYDYIQRALSKSTV
jgi:hypothetical protein